MCTRLVKRAYIHHRWFASMFFDRQHPFQLNLTVRRATPKEVSDVDFGFSPKGGITPIFTSKTSYTKQVYWRYENEDLAKERATKINNGTYCMMCGDPANCTKKIFKKWD